MNFKIGLIGLSIAITSTLIGGCASTQKLSHEKIMNQHPQVASLDSALKQARSKGAEYLAPQSYSLTNNALQRAISEAEDNNANAAKQSATKGLKNSRYTKSQY